MTANSPSTTSDELDWTNIEISVIDRVARLHEMYPSCMSWWKEVASNSVLVSVNRWRSCPQFHWLVILDISAIRP
mgnify:CR=1 FL=1